MPERRASWATKQRSERHTEHGSETPAERERETRLAYRYLYKMRRWLRLRSWQLNREPLCRMCAAKGRVEPARVADHIKPHKGNVDLFFNPDNLQSLCFSCHNSDKQREERGATACDAEGYPTDCAW